MFCCCPQQEGGFQTIPMPLNNNSHALYIFVRAKLVFRLSKKSFFCTNCKILSNSFSSWLFRHLAKNFSYKYSLSSFPSSFLKGQNYACNFTLNDSSSVSPSSPLFDSLLYDMIVSSKSVLSSLSVLDAQKAHRLDVIPPVVPMNCASLLTRQTFQDCQSSNTFSSCRKFVLIQSVPNTDDQS